MQPEILARAEYVLAQYAVCLIIGNGHFKALDSQGILRADVDIALLGACGYAGDYHALDHSVRIAFHDRTIHECAGVALVAVADNVFDGCILVSGNLRPLLAGREACAASAAQTGVGNFGDYLVGGHVKQRLFKGGVAADGNVFLNAFRVYVSAVLKSNAGLLLIEGDILLTNIALAVLMVNKAVDDLVVENGLFYYLLAVVNRDLYVQKPHRLYAHERTHLAEAVAAAVLEADRFVVRFVL